MDSILICYIACSYLFVFLSSAWCIWDDGYLTFKTTFMYALVILISPAVTPIIFVYMCKSAVRMVDWDKEIIRFRKK